MASLLGLPFYDMDLSPEFRATVIDYFIREYEAGRTPNPCVFCNRRIKFGAMWDAAQKLGADYQWDESTQSATISYRGVTLHLTVGQSQYEVNGTPEDPLSKITQEQLDQSNHPEYARGMILMENGVLTAPVHILDHLPLSYHHLTDADGIFTSTLMILP